MAKTFAVWKRSKSMLIVTLIVATATLGWILLMQSASPPILLVMAVLLACTFALSVWVSNPIPAEKPIQTTPRYTLAWRVPIIIVIFLLSLALFGKFSILGFPIIAIWVLLALKQPISRREWVYASGLALIAGVAGLGAGWITFIPKVLWGIIQIPLTLTGFLAGWVLLRQMRVAKYGIGRSRFLAEGLPSALRGFGQGILLGTPWALGNVLLGGSQGGRAAWITSWWQPLTALNPAVAEEAWGRLLLISVLFWFLRKATSDRKAFSVALVVGSYLFAFLHTTGDPISILVSTAITGTLMILPISYVCLYNDLETAIGFHFWMDFVKFAAVLIFFRS